MLTDRRGFALIEVLIAMAILAVAGLAAVRLAAGTLEGLGHARAAEQRQLDAERLLVAHVLLTRRELEARLGARGIGDHAVTVRRLDLDLFEIRVSDLTTHVYRPGTSE